MKDGMKNEIKAVDLAEELAIAIKDFFLAEVCNNEAEITMRFTNGQRFVLRVEALD